MRPSRRSKSSVSAYSSSGSAPGSSATSPSIAATRPGSSDTSTRFAGPGSPARAPRARAGPPPRRAREQVREARGTAAAGRRSRRAASTTTRRRLCGSVTAASRLSRKCVAYVLVLDQREDLLELVDHEDQFGPSAAGAAARPGGAVLVPFAAARSGSAADPATARSSAASSSVERVRAREHVDDRPRSEPSIAPRRSAGTSPARTTDDFPLPLGPTTARNRVSASRSTSCPTSSSRPKKSAASAFLERTQALVGVRHVAPGRPERARPPPARARAGTRRPPPGRSASAPEPG